MGKKDLKKEGSKNFEDFDEFADAVKVSRFPSTFSVLLYIASSVCVSFGPLYLFASTLGLQLKENFSVLATVTFLIVAGLSSSYGNVTFTW
ncbi:hypothetical protein HDU92_006993 [Lobulomyces angularis]|nr:hypothetical protein HDU92_006993 [Lobulomyces angularis]